MTIDRDKTPALIERLRSITYLGTSDGPMLALIHEAADALESALPAVPLEGDDEEFCSRCLAGTESSEHHEKCEAMTAGQMSAEIERVRTTLDTADPVAVEAGLRSLVGAGYTPTREEVRRAWATRRGEPSTFSEEVDAFERWLKVHDSQTRADQIEEDAKTVNSAGPNSITRFIANRLRAQLSQEGDLT